MALFPIERVCNEISKMNLISMYTKWQLWRNVSASLWIKEEHIAKAKEKTMYRISVL